MFDSYSLEKWIVDQSYFFCTNQKEYLFKVFDLIAYNGATLWRKDKVQRAKEIVANVRKYEADSMPVTAESEVKKLIPE